MPTLTLTLPKPHEGQAQVKAEARRFNVLACGRRFGKTTFGIDRCVTPDVLPYPVGWFSPTYKMLTEVWREALRLLKPIAARVSTSDHRIENIAGGVLEFWSLENPDSARGRKYKRIIVDEAAMIPNLMDAWQYALRPTLVDYSGDAYFLSTPKGRGGFWQMWQWGQDPLQVEWASWQMPSNVNPRLKQSELDAMQATMPERVFAQEISATFLEDGGGVFRGVRKAATAQPQESNHHGHNYVFGLDFARENDFTVCTVLDVTTLQMVAMDRFNQIDYHVQVGRVKALAERFKPGAIVAELNSIGVPVIEQMRRQGMPVVPFTTTNASKQIAIDALALAFERGQLQILPDEVLIGELEAYTMERLPSGLLRYGAPDGGHDDCVMSLALAWSGASKTGRRARVGEY
jgi:phage terminase large subunit-like protein